MKISANGISMNYTFDGPTDAPRGAGGRLAPDRREHQERASGDHFVRRASLEHRAARGVQPLAERLFGEGGLERDAHSSVGTPRGARSVSAGGGAGRRASMSRWTPAWWRVASPAPVRASHMTWKRRRDDVPTWSTRDSPRSERRGGSWADDSRRTGGRKSKPC